MNFIKSDIRNSFSYKTFYRYKTFITLCNTIFVPGFKVLYFNCLCLKPMEKRLHLAQTLFYDHSTENFCIYCDKTRKFLCCRSCDLKKQHLRGKYTKTVNNHSQWFRNDYVF